LNYFTRDISKRCKISADSIISTVPGTGGDAPIGGAVGPAGNLFITDGSCMTSTGSGNASLTYMALSARAANYAADRLASGEM
jgi:UDP-3-O-[3-hydroxymyristoyl] glucosamine N-acyltransferase